MQELGRPYERVNRALPLVEITAAFVQAVVAVIDPRSVVESEDRSAGGGSLPVVDLVGPSVRSRRLESMAEALVELKDQSVIPAADTIGLLVNGPEIRVRPRSQVDGGRVGADLRPRCIVDVVGVLLRTEPRGVDILRAPQIDAAAEDSGDRNQHFLGDLPLDSNGRLFRIRRFKLWRKDVQCGSALRDGG